MKSQHLCFFFSAVLLGAALMLNLPKCTAQLLPPGDYNGKSFNQWGVDYAQWQLLTEVAGQSPPNTVNGVRYLATRRLDLGDFTSNATIQPGTAVFGGAFLAGERYDDGSEDDPADPIIEQFVEETLDDWAARITLDGIVVLEGTLGSFSERRFAGVFPEPIPLPTPEPRGEDLNAVALVWATGMGTMFGNLSRGEHTIRNDYSSLSSAFEPVSVTWQITVVPEPATGVLIGIVSVIGLGYNVFGWFRREQTIR